MTSRRALAALTAALVTGGLSLAGGTAAQAATGITVVAAHNDWTNNGKLVLSLTAPTAIKDIKVSLYSVATHQTVATVTDFDLTSGTADNGTWGTASRIQLPDLGSYRIDVSATDVGGDTLSTTGSGYFYYAVQTNLDDATIDRSTVDYFHRSVTISGHLMGQWPSTGAITPMGGLSVQVESYFQNATVTTAADGSFSATLPFTDLNATDIQASFNYDPTHVFYNQSSSRDFQIGWKRTATRIDVNPSTSVVPFKGTVDSTSARLLWDSPDGWEPLAGKTLGSNSFGGFVQRTTDGDGSAVFPATQPLWSNTTLSVGWSSDDPYLTDAQASSSIMVVAPASFRSFTATRADAANVTLQGDMVFSGNLTPSTIPVNIQFSENGTDDWTTVTTVPNASWDGTGYGFVATVPSTGAGFWRATYTGEPQFQNAVSTVKHLTGS
ncbi:hypothetical protein [Kitasatospora sp. NPDC015120]|uniref:hypothetical protein n=1 Tax=Kitasatospora sp. NPDC015120 TaxID=3364023 RepID=UPI0036F4869E